MRAEAGASLNRCMREEVTVEQAASIGLDRNGMTSVDRTTWPIDLSLVAAAAVAYVLCRGWQGWRTNPTTASAIRTRSTR